MPTEEQTEYNIFYTLYDGSVIRAGQKRTIPNHTVTKLAFVLSKYASPTGNVTFAIRKVSDDSILASKVWGDAGNLPDIPEWQKVTFDSPITIDEEVRIYVEFEGGDTANRIWAWLSSSDVKADECLTIYDVAWHDETAADGTYKYTYEVGVKVAHMAAKMMVAGAI